MVNHHSFKFSLFLYYSIKNCTFNSFTFQLSNDKIHLVFFFYLPCLHTGGKQMLRPHTQCVCSFSNSFVKIMCLLCKIEQKTIKTVLSFVSIILISNYLRILWNICAYLYILLFFLISRLELVPVDILAKDHE